MRTIGKVLERGSRQSVVDQEVVLMRPGGVDEGHEGCQPFGLQVRVGGCSDWNVIPMFLASFYHILACAGNLPAALTIESSTWAVEAQ